jgi:hypothetical protein
MRGCGVLIWEAEGRVGCEVTDGAGGPGGLLLQLSRREVPRKYCTVL